MDREMLLQRLKEARRSVANNDRLISEQRALIARLVVDGHDSADAGAILETMRQRQVLHREGLADIIEALQAWEERAEPGQ